MKIRLDDLLVQQGIAQSRNAAQKYILAGQILLEPPLGVLAKAGTLLEPNIKIKFTPLPPYVSRGGEKLESALKFWNISLPQRIALDIGASTGGFSDCLLQNGIKKVYCVDVGYGQMHPKLRQDSRVHLYEKTHILKWSPPWMSSHAAEPDLVTCDLSFISLTKVLGKVKELFLKRPVEFLILIKPQFEAEKKWLKKGILENKEVRKKLIQEIIEYSLEIGFKGAKHFPCPVLGTKGNQEEWFHCFLN